MSQENTRGQVSQQVNLEARDPGLDWTGQFSHKQGGYLKLMPKPPLCLSGAAVRVSGLQIVSRRLQPRKAKGEAENTKHELAPYQSSPESEVHRG